MSQSYPHRQIIRCPLCHDGASPVHIGHSVLVCEHCGNKFRVVKADPGKTGMRLGTFVKSTVKFGPNKEHR